MASRSLSLAFRQRGAQASLRQQPGRQRRHASILFALSALSNSRETQHFNKATRLPRVEHSPALKLIKTSEVDPYPLPEEVREDAASVSGADKDKGAARDGQDVTNVVAGDLAPAASLVGAAIPPPSLGHGAASAAGSRSGVDGKKPPKEQAAMDEEELQLDEQDELAEKDALKAGKAVILEHVQEKRKLRRQLKEAKSQVKKLERKLAVINDQPQQHEDWVRGFLAKFFFVAFCITAFLYSNESGSPGNGERQAMKDVAKREEEARRAHYPRQVDPMGKEVAEETNRVLQDNESMRKKLMTAEDSASKHEAKNVDWTRKAEELKKAVEKKDPSALTRSEQNAYLEALVFLKVKEKPEKRWWRGLFWSQG